MFYGCFKSGILKFCLKTGEKGVKKGKKRERKE